MSRLEAEEEMVRMFGEAMMVLAELQGPIVSLLGGQKSRLEEAGFSPLAADGMCHDLHGLLQRSIFSAMIGGGA